MKLEKKRKVNLCRLNFTCVFQEIWDFNLVFSDWSAAGVLGETEDEEPSCSIELSIAGSGFFRQKIRSPVVPKD